MINCRPTRALVCPLSLSQSSRHLALSLQLFLNVTVFSSPYPCAGGMQDYNYVKGDCMEITLELSCCKYPHRGELPRFWSDNRKSLLVYLAQVHRGVRGLIMDVNGNLVPRASLKIRGRTVSFRSSKRGEYWRLLLPGVYTLGKFLFHFIVFSFFYLCFSLFYFILFLLLFAFLLIPPRSMANSFPHLWLPSSFFSFFYSLSPSLFLCVTSFF